MYEKYKQREEVFQVKESGTDTSPCRLAMLTQHWVKHVPDVPKLLRGKVETDDAPAKSVVHTAGTMRMLEPEGPKHHPREAFLAETDPEHMSVRNSVQTPTIAARTSRESPLATALSRSVAVVSQLAQHVKTGQRTHRMTRASAECHDLLGDPGYRIKRSNVYHEAVIGASVDQTLQVQQLSKSERSEAVTLMQQAGVISR